MTALLKFATLRANILAWTGGLVPNRKKDLLPLLAEIEQLAASGERPAGIEWQTIEELRDGIRSAPHPEVMHHKLHLLLLLDAYEQLVVLTTPPPAEPTVATPDREPAAAETEPPAESA